MSFNFDFCITDRMKIDLMQPLGIKHHQRIRRLAMGSLNMSYMNSFRNYCVMLCLVAMLALVLHAQTVKPNFSERWKSLQGTTEIIMYVDQDEKTLTITTSTTNFRKS